MLIINFLLRSCFSSGIKIHPSALNISEVECELQCKIVKTSNTKLSIIQTQAGKGPLIKGFSTKTFTLLQTHCSLRYWVFSRCSLPKAMSISRSEIFRVKVERTKNIKIPDLKEVFAISNEHIQELTFQRTRTQSVPQMLIAITLA